MRPEYTHDFYSDAVIADPYAHDRLIRDAGPAVWMTQHDAWALGRFHEAREALRDPGRYSSASGVAMNAPFNDNPPGNTLMTDPPLHNHMRGVMGEPLGPRAVAPLQPRFAELADAQVERLVALGRFDAVSDLAHLLPLAVVTELVGLPPAGQERMLPWASAMFNTLGPLNARAVADLPVAQEAGQFIQTLDPARLRPGSWGARLFQCLEAGHITEVQARAMLLDYIGPSLDTTINAFSSALWLFGQFPDQWDLLRQDPSLLPGAINESLRLESPIRAFSRKVMEDHVIGEVTLKAGSRALILYASANRDERKWTDPERFDIRRPAHDHLAFGNGPHSCVGMHLARLEIRCLLEALLKRVSSFEILEVHREPHNVLRGLSRLIVRVEG